MSVACDNGNYGSQGANCGRRFVGSCLRSGSQDGKIALILLDTGCLIEVQAGINYTIFERDTMEDYTGRPRDWGFLLHWGADYLEQVLPPALFARLDDALVDPSYEGKDTPVHCNGKTGEILRRIPGGPTRRFSRRKLRLLLAEGLHIEVCLACCFGDVLTT